MNADSIITKVMPQHQTFGAALRAIAPTPGAIPERRSEIYRSDRWSGAPEIIKNMLILAQNSRIFSAFAKISKDFRALSVKIGLMQALES